VSNRRFRAQTAQNQRSASSGSRSTGGVNMSNSKIGAVQWSDIRKRAGDPGDDASALVTVTFKDNGKAREMRFAFKQQPDKTWRISEIHYPDSTSLLQILRAVYPK